MIHLSMTALLPGRRHLFSPSIRRHLRQAISKSIPTDYSSPCSRSSAACIHGLSLPVVQTTSASLPSSFVGKRWEMASRYLGTVSSSSNDDNDDNPSPSHDVSPSKQMYVWEQTISSSAANASSDATGTDGKNEMHSSKGRVLYRPVSNHNHVQNEKNIGWEVITTPKATDIDDTNKSPLSSISSTINSYKTKDLTNIQNLPFIHHFLPAHYPHSVCPSYAPYASYCFLGSIAGSSAMVLSTQALLVAVGVGTQSAAPMAAALNWVMKDGVGQLGGVIFASQLGKGGVDLDYWRGKFGKWTGLLGGSKIQNRGNFQRGTADTNPKRWRMVAALALDLSTLLEICTPLMGPEWFLPCASVDVMFLFTKCHRHAFMISQFIICISYRYH
mmetsp:Transcript_27760/g.50101  ORF Transcript_27760/g.50101 Transcript_27760/m.50101 type:complete len:387 (-) Transcript_27760:1222-2382(-)